MLLLIFPAIDSSRLQSIQDAAPGLDIVNAQTLKQANEVMPDADAFYGKMTQQLLSKSRQLQWIQCPTASLEHYLFPELIEHPVILTNMRGLFSDVIADQVMGYVVMLARNLHLYRDRQRSRRWAPVGNSDAKTDFDQAPGTLTPVDQSHRHLADCVMGIFGVGEIGSEVARRAVGFGLKILGVDPHPRSIPGSLKMCWDLDRLEEMLHKSDFIVIAAPHTPRTENLFDHRLFGQMKNDAYLINIGRGAIVNSDDLAEALEAKEIAGAALDVFDEEPLAESHPLWDMENVIITPHIAAASGRVPERHLELLCENVRRFNDGDDLLNRVDKESWY
ncbi:MAG: D-2-hydroxyacid dehydrogenase [Planctomycetaceae bacterium]|nr:D-2-hydroxyacid dehydrogenase [Planctomycetaceae bacterium]